MANGPIPLFPGIIPAPGGAGQPAAQGGGQGFNQTFQGLLGNPAFTTGIGLLSGALDRRPVGETLAGGVEFGLGAAGAAAKNDLLRQRMRQEAAVAQQQQQRQGAIQELGGLLSGDDPVDQGQLLPLLAQVAPEAVAQGLLGQVFPQPERAETSLVRNIRALEDPNLSDDQKDLLRKSLERDRNATPQMLQAVELQLRALQLDQARRDAATEERDAATQRTRTTSALSSDLRDAVRLDELVGRLEGTQLEPGTVGIEGRRALAAGVAEASRFFGVDSSTAQQMISDFDEFQKLSRNFAAKSTSRQFGDQATNFQLQQLQQTVPNAGITPDANRQITRNAVQTLLDAADAEGIQLPNRQQFEEFLAPSEPEVEQRGPITVIPPARTRSREAPATEGGNRFRFNPTTGELEPLP